jgi:hypothetical protein
MMRPTIRTISAVALVALALLTVGPVQAADTPLVSAGAVWRYLDDGSNQGTAWRAPAFDDSAWKSGPAQLGYGDGDEVTVLGFGPDPNNKYITSYFRRAFTVVNPSVYTSLTLRLIRDDGAVVYINGTEVYRTNMPGGAIGHTTPASVAIGGGSESTYITTQLSPTVLAAGTNVIAAEVHQANGTSSDLSFALELIASDATTVVRGPYLQMGTPTGITVRWRTNVATDGRVRYGPSPTTLTTIADSPDPATEHELRLTGLQPATRYYYSIGTVAGPLAGGDAEHFFITPAAAGTATPTRIWVIGDAGTASVNQTAVRDAYLAFTGSRHTDLWLMLGDNAYPDGTDAQYQAAVFDMYPMLLRSSPVWPTLGNHDGHTADSATQSGPYYDIFTLPTQGEAGGVASGTEAYYSFDHGNIHFIVLDSFDSDRSVTGPMLTWLQADLASTTRPWVIAFWHHPYSKGSHNSDTEVELVQMRENALPILEAAGVDLVLSGHSHSYERSFLIDGHYGVSSTFTAANKKDGGSGREDGTGAYRKPSLGPAPHEGAVYAVAGSSGQISGGTLNHPAMFISLNSLGSMVIDVDGNRLDAKFIDQSGVARDYFTLVKGVSAPTAPSGLGASAVSSTRVDLAWTDNASNEDGFQVERSTDGTTFTPHGTAGANATAYTDATAQPSTTYWYRVRATNTAGASGWSNVASATTPAPPPTPPAAPSGLTATALSRTQIRLAWTDNSGNEQGFRIERSTDGTSFTEIATVGAGVTTYTNTGLKANRTYWYRVRAYNAGGVSAYSNTVSATTPRR